MLLELIFPIQPKNTDLIPSSFETHRAELLILQVVYSSTTNIQKEKIKCIHLMQVILKMSGLKALYSHCFLSLRIL